MKEVFNWGIIGPGRIARKFAEAVWGIKEASVYAVASRSCTEPDQLVKEFRAQKHYATYEELVVDPDVDAIYIATPHRFHYENAKLCLQAGKPVLCEKSFTVNAREARELIELSESKQVFIMEALWSRFLPIYDKVREWIDAGEIGDILLVESTLGFVADRALEDRWLNIELAGGTVLDLSVYNAAVTQWVNQKPPDKIFAIGKIGETGVDESVSVLLSYENGAAAYFTSTFQLPTSNELVITGTKGRVIVHPFFMDSTKATLVIGKKTKTVKKPYETNGFEYQVKAVMRAIRAGELDCPQMTRADSLANMETLDEIRRQVGMSYPFE